MEFDSQQLAQLNGLLDNQSQRFEKLLVDERQHIHEDMVKVVNQAIEEVVLPALDSLEKNLQAELKALKNHIAELRLRSDEAATHLLKFMPWMSGFVASRMRSSCHHSKRSHASANIFSPIKRENPQHSVC